MLFAPVFTFCIYTWWLLCNCIKSKKGELYMIKVKRFGVIFSGGTAAGMDATLEYLCRYCFKEGSELIGFKYGWKGLIENNIVNISMSSTLGIGLEAGGTYLGSCSKINVFNHKGNDYSEICYQTYKSRRLDGIFVLGGDGTNRQANELNEKYPEMKFIWISATLDRDVVGCDDTIGFHTAVENSASVIASMAIDGKTMYRHTITECMGRHTGLVTIHAVDRALRKYRDRDISIDMVLVPEIEFDISAICNRFSQAPHPLNIVISEGIVLDDSTLEPEAIAGHHKDLANTCKKLAAILQPHSKLPIKTAIVGYLQRTGPLSSTDIFLAEHCAKLGVREAIQKNESMAIVFADGAFQSIPMKDLVKKNVNAGEKKKEKLLTDPVVHVIQDQLSAAAFREII